MTGQRHPFPLPDPSDFQGRLDSLVDGILLLLKESGAAGVELDPLGTIVERLRVRGSELDFSQAPPMLRMLLQGMGLEA